MDNSIHKGKLIIITKNTFSTLMLIGIFLIQTSAGFAQVRLNNLFTDNMVVMRKNSFGVRSQCFVGPR